MLLLTLACAALCLGAVAVGFAVAAYRLSRESLLLQKNIDVLLAGFLQRQVSGDDLVKRITAALAQSVVIRLDVKDLQDLNAALNSLQEGIDKARKACGGKLVDKLSEETAAGMKFRDPDADIEPSDIPF